MDLVAILSAVAGLLNAGAAVTAAVSQLFGIVVAKVNAGTAPGPSAQADRETLEALARVIAAAEDEAKAKAALVKALVGKA